MLLAMLVPIERENDIKEFHRLIERSYLIHRFSKNRFDFCIIKLETSSLLSGNLENRELIEGRSGVFPI